MSTTIGGLNRLTILRSSQGALFSTCFKCLIRNFHLQRSHVRLRHRIYQPKPVKRDFSGSVKTETMSEFAGKKDFIFRQLMEYKSFTYTYLLADPKTKEAILIDPVVETVERDVKILKDLGLELKFGVNTHVHADHITGTGLLKKKFPECKSVIAEVSGAKADVFLKEGDKVQFGQFELEAKNTPGHTNGCMTYIWHDKGMAFTGDALLIRGCGRTDFQQGDSKLLYESVHDKILSLPPYFSLYPAHDYTGQTVTTVAEEKQYNPRLSKSKDEFVKIMSGLNLPYPKQIDKALPANLLCGIQPTDETPGDTKK